MFRYFAAAGAALALSYPASAQENPASRFLQCFKIKNSDAERLDCYDGLSREMQILASRLRREVPNSNTPCIVEDWSISKAELLAVVSGATSCETGRLSYRFYDAESERFLLAGSSRIDGFSFIFSIAPGKLSETVTMKYVID